MNFIRHNINTDLGLIPSFVDNQCKDDAVTQIHNNYAHGGGWRDLSGYQIHFTQDGRVELLGPEKCDPPLKEMARGLHGRELVFVFEFCMVAVVNSNDVLRVARID